MLLHLQRGRRVNQDHPRHRECARQLVALDIDPRAEFNPIFRFFEAGEYQNVGATGGGTSLFEQRPQRLSARSVELNDSGVGHLGRRPGEELAALRSGSHLDHGHRKAVSYRPREEPAVGPPAVFAQNALGRR